MYFQRTLSLGVRGFGADNATLITCVGIVLCCGVVVLWCCCVAGAGDGMA